MITRIFFFILLISGIGGIGVAGGTAGGTGLVWASTGWANTRVKFVNTAQLTPLHPIQKQSSKEQSSKEIKDRYTFTTPAQSKQFYTLLTNLRCLVCQNQSLLNSSAPLAMDLKQIIYQKIIKGESTQDITTYLTHLYGDFILYNPPLVERTYVLWFVPIGGLLILLIIFGVLFFKKKHG